MAWIRRRDEDGRLDGERLDAAEVGGVIARLDDAIDNALRRNIAVAHHPDTLVVDRQSAVDLGKPSLERLSKPVSISLAEDGLHHPRRLELGQQRVQRFTPLWLTLGLFAQFGGQFFLGPVVPALDLVGDEVAAHTAHDARQGNQRAKIALIGRRNHRQ